MNGRKLHFVVGTLVCLLSSEALANEEAISRINDSNGPPVAQTETTSAFIVSSKNRSEVVTESPGSASRAPLRTVESFGSRRLLAALLVTFALGIVTALVVRRPIRAANSGSTKLKVSSTISLAPRCCVSLIRACDQDVLVARDSTGIKTVLLLNQNFDSLLQEPDHGPDRNQLHFGRGTRIRRVSMSELDATALGSATAASSGLESTGPIDYLDAVQQAAASPAFDSLAPPLKTALFFGALSLFALGLVCLTSFTRIIIVLSFVRRALTTQEIPPNPVMIGLASFLTLYTMGPTLDAVYSTAVTPYLAKEIGEASAVKAALPPLREFMFKQTRTADLSLFMEMADIESYETEDDVPLRILVPSFMISELKTAFIMGFCIYVPFVLIDLLVSTILMSLGMMMMPPVVVSAPIKLLLFVLVDGWQLIVMNLGKSFL